MRQPTQQPATRSTIRILLIAILLAFAVALFVVMRPFLAPLLWSIVLATATWPLFIRIRSALRSPAWVAPLLTTAALGVLVLLVFAPLPFRLATELRDLGANLRGLEVGDLAAKFTEVPVIGMLISWAVSALPAESNLLSSLVEQHQSSIVSFATSAAQGVLSAATITFASLVGCFLLYRHGEGLFAQLVTILTRVGGAQVPELISTVHLTVRGAAYSVLATAIAQGALAGIGYALAGVPMPLLLALVTAVAALIPFGPPLVYLPVVGYLLFFTNSSWYWAIGLAAWAILVVSTVDNILRPLFISQTTKLPATLVFIGVLGGVIAFGLLGVFIGPSLMAVARWLWLDFAREDGDILGTGGMPPRKLPG